MTEQPPSASREALDIIDSLRIFPGPGVISEDSRDDGADAIDALIAQRVSAAVRRICPNALHVGTYHASCDYPDCRDDSQCEFWKKVDGVEAPAERPAPDGPAMAEQPPSAEAEAIANRWVRPHVSPNMSESDAYSCAQEIDALCEQRVSAETERCLAAVATPVGEAWSGDVYAVAEEIRERIRAPAERPAPEGPRRVMEGMRREGLPDDHPLQSGPSALAASTGEQPASPAAVVDAIDPLEQARQRGFEQGIAAAAEYAEARPNEQPAVLAGLMRDLGSMYAAERPAPPQQQGQTEWLVIESSMKNSVFAPEGERDRKGYIPRETAEKVLGRNLSGPQWFTREDGDKMREHPDWRDTVPPERPAPEGPQQSGDIVRWGVLRLLSGDLASDEEKVDAELDLDDFQFWFQENPKHTGFKQLLINLSGEQWGKLKELPLVEERSPQPPPALASTGEQSPEGGAIGPHPTTDTCGRAPYGDWFSCKACGRIFKSDRCAFDLPEAIIRPADPDVLRASLSALGPSHDGAVERDLAASTGEQPTSPAAVPDYTERARGSWFMGVPIWAANKAEAVACDILNNGPRQDQTRAFTEYAASKIAAALSAVASERDEAAFLAFGKRVDTEEVAYQAGSTDERAALLAEIERLQTQYQRDTIEMSALYEAAATHEKQAKEVETALLARLQEPDVALVDAVARALDSNEVMDVPDHTRGPHIGFPEAEKRAMAERDVAFDQRAQMEAGSFHMLERIAKAETLLRKVRDRASPTGTGLSYRIKWDLWNEIAEALAALDDAASATGDAG